MAMTGRPTFPRGDAPALAPTPLLCFLPVLADWWDRRVPQLQPP
jgi:hypothetical protein